MSKTINVKSMELLVFDDLGLAARPMKSKDGHVSFLIAAIKGKLLDGSPVFGKNIGDDDEQVTTSIGLADPVADVTFYPEGHLLIQSTASFMSIDDFNKLSPAINRCAGQVEPSNA